MQHIFKVELKELKDKYTKDIENAKEREWRNFITQNRA